jgi:acetyltransferase-like isoleucine patch superfamily enzyme
MTIVARGLGFSSKASGALMSRWRNFYYRSLGVEISGYAWLRCIDIPRNYSRIFLANGVALDEGVTLLASGDTGMAKMIVIGENTYINRNAFIDASMQITIGRGVGIGPSCYVTDHDHGTEPDIPIMDQPLVSVPTTICDGVWLGANCIVLKGVTIGKNTVVGAGSMVVRDLPANIIAEGRPARAVRKR